MSSEGRHDWTDAVWLTNLRILEKVNCYQSLDQGGSREIVLKEYKVSFGEGEAIPALDGDGCPTWVYLMPRGLAT